MKQTEPVGLAREGGGCALRVTRNPPGARRSRTGHTGSRTALACLGLLGSIAGCGPVAGGEGSESHFLCERSSDCDHLGAGYVCEDRQCTARSLAEDAATSARALLAEPGVCFGEATRCDPLTYEEFEPGPVEDACAPYPTEVLAVSPEWVGTLHAVKCPATGCVQRATEIAASSGGGVWVSAGVWPPASDTPLGGDQLGTSLSRLDAKGSLALSPRTAFRSPGGEPIADALGLQLGPAGTLFRAAPSAQFDGIELTQYDADGHALASHSAVTHVRGAMVAWSHDGSSVVLYRHNVEPTATEGGTTARLINVARFDSNGRLLWNQTALEGVRSEPGFLWSFLVGVGLDAEGNTLLAFGVTAEEQNVWQDALRAVKLGPNGNALWAKRISGYPLHPFARALPDGSSFLSGTELHLEGGIPFYMDEIDSDGRGVRRRAFPDGEASVAAVDGQRMIHYLPSESGDAARFRRVDLESKECIVFEIPLDGCNASSGGYGCSDVSLSAADGVLYFASEQRVGAARIP